MVNIEIQNDIYFKAAFMGYPSCCEKGIMHNFRQVGLSKIPTNKLKEAFDTQCKSAEVNSLLFSFVSPYLLEPLSKVEGMKILDVNFNRNTGNKIFLLKYNTVI